MLVIAVAVAPPALHAQTLPPWQHVPPKAGASTLPATPPTSPSPLSAVPAPIAATPVANTTPAHRAEVTYSGGLIDVRANNSSLHQILRDISRQTGMTISGGIADERVFGNYGPATASSVLATLIDGTGTNMLLRAGDATHPMELVLTPRTGGPDPAGYALSEDADTLPTRPVAPAQPAQQIEPLAIQRASGAQNQIASPPSIPQPVNSVNGSPSNTSPTASTFPTTNSVPLDSLPTPSTTPSTSGIVDAPNPPSSGTSAGASPNTGLTPEQVYQQLLRLEQQQQQHPQQQHQ